MRSSHSLGRATYVVVDPMTEEAHTGSSREQASEAYTSSSSNTSRSAAPTRPPRARAIPVRRGKGLSQRVYGEKKDTQTKGKLRKRGARRNESKPEIIKANQEVMLRAALSRIDKLKEAKSDLFKQHSDAKKALSFTRKCFYGSLALNAGLIAYCIFKR